jgi:hypothetical protein
MPIKNRRLWLFPVIVLGVLFLFELFMLYYRYNELKELTRGAYISMSARILKRDFYKFWTFFWPILLLIEVVIYILLRKKLYNRSWVIIHTLLTFLFFFAIPFTIGLFTLYFSINDLRGFYSIWRYSFWLRMAVAHLFFILTIVKSFRKHESVHETPGLLDEFVS